MKYQQVSLSLFLLVSLAASCYAGIYPSPQISSLGGEKCKISQINYMKLNPGDTILTNPPPVDEENIGSLVDRAPAEGVVLPQLPGAYAIFIVDDVLQVYSYDEAGRYYAKQSLSQILADAQDAEKKSALRDPYPDAFNEALARTQRLPQGRVVDWPDLPQRGLIEDLRQEKSLAWSHEERLEQIRFMGRNKLNLYLMLDYAPPYSEQKQAEICETMQLAKEHHVTMVQGLTATTSAAGLCQSFELLYALGLRDFAVQVHRKEEGTLSVQEISELCDALMDQFFDKYDDLSPLYLLINNKGGDAEPLPEAWIAELVAKLHTRINIIWEAEQNLSQAQQEKLAHLLGRAPILTWLPDPAQPEQAVQQAIPEGKVKAEAVLKGHIAGLLTPQMEHGDLKDIRLFTLADYSWNIQDYKAYQSKQEADKRLEPVDASSSPEEKNLTTSNKE